MKARRCAHIWGASEGYYYEPVSESARVRGGRWLHLLYGESVVSQRCTKCGECRNYSVVGMVELPKVKARVSDLSKLIVRVTDEKSVGEKRTSLRRRIWPQCEHEWGEASGVYFRAYPRRVTMRGMGDGAMNAITRGITTLTHRCLKCNMVESWMRTGVVDTPGVDYEIIMEEG